MCIKKTLFYTDTQICLEKASFSIESIISYTSSEQRLPGI